MSNTLFDTYSLKARWLPAVITALPILALALAFVGVNVAVGSFLPAAAFAAISFAAVEYTRTRGQACEKRLVTKWGGMPTTRALRVTSRTGDLALTRRRQQVEALSGHQLPTALDEERDPVSADTRYAQAVKTVIIQLRHDGRGADLLQDENVSYGFRRNLRALRPLGISVLLASIAGCAAGYVILEMDVVALGIVFILELLVGAFWLFVVRDEWVSQQADTYAERMFSVLDAQAQRKPPAAED
ncbi:hypothetical protein NB037_01950 [Rathayibacter sp. ZW T2_19]|uniref:Uncharacterized protein n=1 Tax=Rathayibacter rubneri TaxID=2950106 RepID=A0A9X2IR77_9MICO|nr:hypothetical protein [Rathayibacter rubneri]MCM6761171.1 hypothetical protein [Rathayibacter rubneri]